MGAKVAVVIPSFKTTLTVNEKISLMQAKQILGRHDIFFALPYSAKINYGCKEITEVRYPDKFFSSIRMYSRFMLTLELYESFRDYDYILIYQLDAFVFEDRLNEFCDLGFDYIGAPWIDGIFFRKNEKEKMWYVGNGGFSLRKVNAFQNWIKEGDFTEYTDYINEDLLIAVYGVPFLNIAPISVALSFSFEMSCDRCIKLTSGKLPFGCHAWAKHDLLFWKPFIEKYHYCVGTTEKNKSNSDGWQRRLNEFCNNQYNNKLKRLLPSSYSNTMCGGIYIWGTGQWGISLLQKLVEEEISVAGFVDNNLDRCKKKILSYEIIHSSSFINSKRPIIVAIKNNYLQVEKQLLEWNYRKYLDYITLQDIFSELEI